MSKSVSQSNKDFYGIVRLFVCIFVQHLRNDIHRYFTTVAALHSNACAVWSQHVYTVVHCSQVFIPTLLHVPVLCRT